MARREYEMTEEQLTKILGACRPVPYMVIGDIPPRSPLGNANAAWAALGREMGFDGKTARPVADKSQRFFTAEPVEPDDLRERLAAIQYDIWARWMRYLFSCCNTGTDDWTGDPVLMIPKDKVDRWKRQMETPYADLTEKEKDSDREQADKILAVIAGGDRR